MATFLVRVWLPDRPGALGAVASRIGAVRGDVVGIDILERGAGRAIDELVVEIPDPSLISLLVTEVSQVDGVDVEDVRPVGGALPDSRLDALETAALLVGATSVPELLRSLVGRARRGFEAEWCSVVELAGGRSLAGEGECPPPVWLAAFVEGSRSSAPVAAGESGPDDIACALLEQPGLALVLGRPGRPFRARERRQLGALARIGEQRAAELGSRRPWRAPEVG